MINANKINTVSKEQRQLPCYIKAVCKRKEKRNRTNKISFPSTFQITLWFIYIYIHIPSLQTFISIINLILTSHFSPSPSALAVSGSGSTPGFLPYTKYTFTYICSKRSFNSFLTPTHSTSTSSRVQPRMRVNGARVYGPMASNCCTCWTRPSSLSLGSLGQGPMGSYMRSLSVREGLGGTLYGMCS